MDAAAYWDRTLYPALEEAAAQAGVSCEVVASPGYPNIGRDRDRREFVAVAAAAMKAALSQTTPSSSRAQR
jgi:hypothetical protein